jgi:ribosome maturation factor RimP
MYLRVAIDKPGGVTIDDCVDVSRKLSDALDANDPTDDAYILEVSSPGLGRKLRKDREFERSLGRDVDIKFYKPVDGSKETTGKLVAFDSKTLTIEPADPSPPTRTFGRSEIASVKLHVDF